MQLYTVYLYQKTALHVSGGFIERGCICHQRKGHSGRPSVSEQVVDRVRESCFCTPRNYRIDVCRVTGGGTLSLCNTTWNCMSLCNCSHQFCKNIAVSFDFITIWNQWVFLCSPCTIHYRCNYCYITTFIQLVSTYMGFLIFYYDGTELL
jgi:hypothetical protein